MTELESRLEYEREVASKLSIEVSELKEQLRNAISKTPKFGWHQFVYFPDLETNEILKGQIDIFDCYTRRCLVHFGNSEDELNCMGDCWCSEDELFATRKEAEKTLAERRGAA